MSERYIGVGEETVYGTAVAATDFIEGINEAVNTRIEDKAQETMAIRADEKSQSGLMTSEGSFEMYVEPENGFGWLLKWALGDPVSAVVGTSTTYTHTWSPPSDTLDAFTVRIGRETKEHVFPGCLIDQLEISAETGDYAIARVTVMGKDEDAPGSLGTPTFSDLKAFIFTGAAFEIDDGVNTTLRTFNLLINNNTETDAHTMGDGAYQAQPDVQRLDITGTLDLSDFDNTEFTSFTGGSSVKLMLKFTGEVVAASPTHTYELTITLPKCIYQDYESNISARDVQRARTPFKAYYDDSVDYIAEIVLKNEVASYP